MTDYNSAKSSIESLRQSKDFIFLIGNGINRHYDKNNNGKKDKDDDLSWDALMKKIAKNVDVNTDLINNEKSIWASGLTNPELFNILESASSFSEVRDALKKWLNDYSNKKLPVVSSLKEWGVPVLTTNYDTRMHEGKRRVMRNPNGNALKSYYPFFSYYAEQDVTDVCKDFAFWHIHGVYNAPRRLQISLSNYLYYCKYTQPIIANLFKENTIEPDYTKSWLYPFFTKPLFIVGLGLNPDETFLRWLLIQRKQLMGKQGLNPIGYYACIEDELLPGKEFFLKQVGLTPLTFKGFPEMYQTIFKTK